MTTFVWVARSARRRGDGKQYACNPLLLKSVAPADCINSKTSNQGLRRLLPFTSAKTSLRNMVRELHTPYFDVAHQWQKCTCRSFFFLQQAPLNFALVPCIWSKTCRGNPNHAHRTHNQKLTAVQHAGECADSKLSCTKGTLL